MARIIPLLRTADISVHSFDHPVEHEDQPYEEIAGAFMCSFVEEGTFNLEVGDLAAAGRGSSGDSGEGVTHRVRGSHARLPPAEGFSTGQASRALPTGSSHRNGPRGA